MAALAAARKVAVRDGKYLSAPVKAGVILYGGALVVLTAGVARPGRTATGDIAFGVTEHTVVGGASDGDVRVTVSTGIRNFANSASADLIALSEVGKDCYIVDDQTVAKTDGTGTRSRAGKVVDVDADGVWVNISPAA